MPWNYSRTLLLFFTFIIVIATALSIPMHTAVTTGTASYEAGTGRAASSTSGSPAYFNSLLLSLVSLRIFRSKPGPMVSLP